MEHLGYREQMGGPASRPIFVSSPVKWECPSITLGNKREEAKRDRNGALSSSPLID